MAVIQLWASKHLPFILKEVVMIINKLLECRINIYEKLISALFFKDEKKICKLGPGAVVKMCILNKLDELT